MNNIPRVLVMSITAGDESFSADRVSVKMRSTFQLIHPRHKEMQNLTNQTSILAHSQTMTALIAVTHTTCSRSLREPHQVMLCQSAAELSVHSASHPSTLRFNRGNVLARGSCTNKTVIIWTEEGILRHWVVVMECAWCTEHWTHNTSRFKSKLRPRGAQALLIFRRL